MKDFLRWCAQFRGFPYSHDCYGHRIDLQDGRTLKTRK